MKAEGRKAGPLEQYLSIQQKSLETEGLEKMYSKFKKTQTITPSKNIFKMEELIETFHDK